MHRDRCEEQADLASASAAAHYNCLICAIKVF